MKNFRKVLALILVAATLFSFTAMASATTAASYTDGDEVNYVDAVDVLSAIGILNGYTDGSFKPTQNIERDEMAKMVAVLSNAGDDVDDLYASACTFADTKNTWAASYVAYCAQTGIVAGRSSTTFDPDANVTGIETAKMLLCVLGFDAKEQGYVGSNWKVNVLADAKSMGLLDGFASGYDVSKAITREEAAQMFLNALNANLVVGTLSNNVISISTANRVTNLVNDTTLTHAEKYGWYNLYGNVIVSKSKLFSIYKNLNTTESNDCQGRPGYVWTYYSSTGKKVLNKFYADTVTKVYTTASTLKSNYGSLAKVGYTVETYVDGVLQDKDNGSGTKNWTGAVSTTILGAVDAITGNGVRTEAYVDEVNEKLTIVVINPYWGVVQSVSELYDTFTVYNQVTKQNETYSRDGADISTGDVVLFHLCDDSKLNHTYTNNGLHDVTVLEPVTGSLEYTRTYDGYPDYDYITASGETYYFNIKNETRLGNADLYSDLGIYLDEYGYILLTADWTDEGYGYGYVVESSIKESQTKKLNANGVWVTTTSYTGNVVSYTGEAGVLEVTTGVTLDQTIVDQMETVGQSNGTGALVKYQTLSSGKLALVSGAEFAPVGTVVSASKNCLKAGTVYANKNTEFLIRTTNPATGAKTYTEIIGYQNLDAKYVSYVTASGNTNIQYLDEDGNGIAEHVYIDAIATKTAATFMVLYRDYVGNSITVPGYADYEGYWSLVDGEEAYILFKSGTVGVNASNTVAPGVLYKTAYALIDAEMTYDDNLPLYIAVEAYTPVAMEPLVFKLDIADGEYQVNLGTTKNPDWEICAENFNVYYIMDNDDWDIYYAWYYGYVSTYGYVKVSNALYPELTEKYDSLTGYVLYDSNGNVSDIYIVGYELVATPY